MTGDVQLIIGGTSFGGWERIEINRQLEAIAGGFDLRVTENYPGAQHLFSISTQDTARVTIDGETVITGFVDEVGTDYDAQSHDIAIKGRDATGDLVDCCYRDGPMFFNGASFALIVATVLEAFPIAPRLDNTATGLPNLTNFAISPGETVFEIIDKLCRFAGVLPISDGLGGLLFTRAGSAAANTRLKLGDNCERASFRRSDKDRFSDYLVLGQAAGGETLLSYNDYGGLKGEAFDQGMKRFRPLVLIAELGEPGGELVKNRALWEASIRYGRSWRGTYRTAGWRDAAGALWKPNAMVQVIDEFAGINESLLICGVRFTLDEDGSITELTVTRREAFDLIPLAGKPSFDAEPTYRLRLPPGISGSAP